MKEFQFMTVEHLAAEQLTPTRVDASLAGFPPQWDYRFKSVKERRQLVAKLSAVVEAMLCQPEP